VLNRKTAFLRVVALSIFLGAGARAMPAPAAPPADGDKVFVGYVFGRIEGIRYDLYTHLCHAFVVADEDGRPRGTRNVPSRELTAAAHKAGVKVLLSLGGWGWDEQFAAMVKDPAAEDRYVEAVLAMVKDYDYDGVDLDWEYPDTDEEVVGFERLTERLRTGVDAIGQERGRPMLVTMAASANPGTLRWLKRDFLLANMDWVNVMTYDYAGGWSSHASHNSPLFASSKLPAGAASIDRTVRYLLDEHKMPPERVALGLPLYGRAFAVAEPYTSLEGVRESRLGGDYSRLVERQREGWTRRWDDEIKAPWLLAPDGKAVIGYDDAESLALKTNWAMERGLRGVFFWEVSGDRLDDGSHPLQEAARQALSPQSADSQ
jgi:chitinase